MVMSFINSNEQLVPKSGPWSIVLFKHETLKYKINQFSRVIKVINKKEKEQLVLYYKIIFSFSIINPIGSKTS